jgi:fibronectin type 3 domain-containing protein
VNIGILQNAITWSAVSGATSYTIYWGTAPGVTKSSLKLNSVSVNDAVHSNLDSATTYYYAITASNGAGESPLSSEVKGRPVATPTADSVGLPVPANLKVQMVGAAAVITFDAPQGAATFNVYKDSSAVATKANLFSTGKTTNLYIDTAGDASSHFYSIIAVDRAGSLGTQSAAILPTGAPKPVATPNITAPNVARRSSCTKAISLQALASNALLNGRCLNPAELLGKKKALS